MDEMDQVTTEVGMSKSMIDQDVPVSEEQIAAYRRDGFIRFDDILTGEDLRRLREAVAGAVEKENSAPRDPARPKSFYEQIFIQKVNLWRRHPEVARFVLCRRFANLAARLSGRAVRVWHDQALFKEPREGAKTPWHQDAHYWPHKQRKDQITIWIALKAATLQNGCLAFIPGTQKLENVAKIDLGNPQDIFDYAPQVKGAKAVACELGAGSATYHNGLTFHYAGPNKSEEMREAFAIIYMPDGTAYDGAKHIVTDGLGLAVGEKLEGDSFPLVSTEQ